MICRLVHVLQLAAGTMRAMAVRSRTTSTFERGARDQAHHHRHGQRQQHRAIAQHARTEHRGAAFGGWSSAGACRFGWQSGSARAGSPPCPSPCCTRPRTGRSQCTRTAGRCGCRCPWGRPARTASSRCSRPARRPCGSTFLLRTPRGSPRCAVVGDDQGVLVEHGALKAGVGAHVLAHLLAHKAGKAVGGKRVERHPEQLPAALPLQNFGPQGANGHKKAHKGKARPQRHAHPGQLFEAFLASFSGDVHAALSRRMRALRSPSMRFSSHMKISV